MSDTRDNTALSKRLTPEQREELCIALFDQRCGLAGGVTLVKTWNIATSISAMHRFFGAERSGWTLNRARSFATETGGMLPEEWEDAQRKMVQQRAFELASSPDVTSKELLKLRDQEIKLINARQNETKLKQAERSLDQAQQKLEQAERRVKALEDQAEAAKISAARAKEAIQSGGMDEETRRKLMEEMDRMILGPAAAAAMKNKEAA